MSLVSVHNEWDPLEEMIVGIAHNAQVPRPDSGLFALDYCDNVPNVQDIPSGLYDQKVIDESNEDLDLFSKTLESCGVIVKRPEITDHSQLFSTPDWQSDGEYNYCPRDVLLPIGNTIIETPMVLRSRFFEPLAYRKILLDYFNSGSNWISAPKPQLLDNTYNLRPTSGSILNNHEPIFDAANVLKIGKDILYLESCSGNQLGGKWLQRILGDEYRVQTLKGVYEGTHIDTTITVVKPGLVVLNPERMSKDQVPELFKHWDIIWCPEMIDTGYSWSYPRSSIWQGMNFIMVNPSLAIINDKQTPLIKEIEKRKIDVIPLPLRNSRNLSGGFHCVSIDIRRKGTLEDYTK